jgi:hypothetical protein
MMLAIHLARKNRLSLAGFMLGLGVALTKVTTGIIALTFLLRRQAGSRTKEAIAVLIPLVVIYGSFAALRATPFGFAASEGMQVGGNSISSLLLHLLYALHMPVVRDWAAIATTGTCPLIGIAIGAVMGRRRSLPLYEFFAVVFLCFFLASLKSCSIYRTWIICPMVAIALRRRCMGLFALWSLNSAFVESFAGAPVLVYVQSVLGVVLELALLRAILTGEPTETITQADG